MRSSGHKARYDMCELLSENKVKRHLKWNESIVNDETGAIREYYLITYTNLLQFSQNYKHKNNLFFITFNVYGFKLLFFQNEGFHSFSNEHDYLSVQCKYSIKIICSNNPVCRQTCL